MTRLRYLAGPALLLTALVLPVNARAQQAASDGSPFGIGFQSSFPAYGLSGLYDASEKITAQLVLGALGSVTTVSGRLLYHFNRQPKYNFFGFGTVGFWRYSFGGLTSGTENTVGFGGGGGIELDWEQIITNEGQSGTFPPLFTTIDIGLTYANFDVYNWSLLTWGVGLHYRF